MSYLNEQEILTLLETMGPDEIENTQQDRLSASGRKLLAELRRDILSGEGVFADYGRRFRAVDGTAPTVAGETKENRAAAIVWLFRSLKVPHWMLGAVAILAGVAVLPNLLNRGALGTTRGHSLTLDQIDPINRELVELLIKRGEFLMEAGNQSGSRLHHQEARGDLMQAYAR